MPAVNQTSNGRSVLQEEPAAYAASSDLALLASKRVSVLVEGNVVPLLPGHPLLDSTRSPWSGLYLEKHNLAAVSIPAHEHATFCLHLQTSEQVGMDWYSSGRSGHQITGAGNVIFLTPGTRDSLLWHGPSQRIVVSIDPLLIKQAADQMESKGTPEFDNLWSFQDEQLRLLVTEMEREMSTGWAMGSLYGDSLGMSLAIALIKKYGRTSLPFPQLKGGLSRPRLRQVLAYMKENLHHDIRLQELAGLVGLSNFHFMRSFRQSTGSTPHQYLTQMRVSRAQSLLLLPQWTILQIADAVGFADPSRFSKVFRTSTGVSPSKWRSR